MPSFHFFTKFECKEPLLKFQAQALKANSRVGHFVFDNITRFEFCSPCHCFVIAMGKFGRKLSDALKKITGASLSHSRGSSSAHHSAEYSESPMHEEEEAMPMESLAEHMEVEDDAPYLDLEGD